MFYNRHADTKDISLIYNLCFLLATYLSDPNYMILWIYKSTELRRCRWAKVFHNERCFTKKGRTCFFRYVGGGPGCITLDARLLRDQCLRCWHWRGGAEQRGLERERRKGGT